MNVASYTLSCTIVLFCFNNVSAQQPVSKNMNLTIHQLNATQYKELSIVLSKYTASLKDTIYIKYDFDDDHCWDSLEKRSAVFIHTIIGAYRNEIKEAIVRRPGISVFQFKEKGKNWNNFKKWNTDIKTDRDNEIADLIFKKSAACGSSAIILPGGKFLLISSDAHFGALKIEQEKIVEILK